MASPLSVHKSSGNIPVAAVAPPVTDGKTLAVLAHSTALHSAQEQRNLVDSARPRGKWRTCYTLINEIPRYPTGISKNQFAAQVWRQISSPAFKIFQQLFCNPDTLVVPGDHRKRVSDKMLRATPEAFPRLFSVVGCLVDPARVGEAIAVKMRIIAEKIPPEKRSSKELIQELSTASAITLLKYYWACSRPLGPRQPGKANERIRVIGSANDDIRKEFSQLLKLSSVNPCASQIGAILVTSEQKPGQTSLKGQFFKPLKLQYFSDIYAALRSTYHEARGYEDEQQKLVALKAAWEGFLNAYRPLWVTSRSLEEDLKLATKEEERALINKSAAARNAQFLSKYLPLLEESILFFRGSIHEQKQKALDRLVSMKESFLESPNQRINPVHFDLQSAANQIILDLRNQDIRIKGTSNHNDQDLLLTTLTEHTQIFRNLHQNLLEKAQLIDTGRKLFSTARLTLYQLDREINSLRIELSLGIRQLDRVRVKPFTVFKDVLHKADQQLEQGLRTRNRSTAKNALCKMFFATRTFYLNNSVENARFALLKPWDEVVPRLEKIKEDLLDAVATKDGSPNQGAQDGLGRRTTFKKPGSLENSALGKRLNESTDRLISTISEIQDDIVALQLVEAQKNHGLPLIRERAQLYEKARMMLKSVNALSFLEELQTLGDMPKEPGKNL